MLLQRNIHVSCSLILVTQLFVARAVALPSATWSAQFGGDGGESASATVLDDRGNTFITGSTQGFLPAPHHEGTDAYLIKYDRSGNHIWTKEFGSENLFEIGTDLATDSIENVFLSANIGTSRDSNRNGYLGKFSSNGDMLWDQRLGGSGSASATGVAVGGAQFDTIFLGGHTSTNLASPIVGKQDGYLAKYGSNGDQVWIRQFGTQGLDWVADVAADLLGNAFVAGSTEGGFAVPNRGLDDLYVRKYDREGDILWTHQAGTAFDDTVSGITVDNASNVYITGSTQGGGLVGGAATGVDAFVRKLDSDGEVVWTKWIPLLGNDYGTGLAIGSDGSIRVSGQSSLVLGSLDFHAFFAELNSTGEILNIEVFEQSSELKDVATNSRGDIVYVGDTNANLYGTKAGNTDGFVFKQTLVPEPASWNLLNSLLWGLLTLRPMKRTAIIQRC